MKSYKVLVVDDERSILEAFKFILEDFGFQVETIARDGNYLIRRADIFHPDIIILDILLSGSDGRTVCKLLKSREKTRDIPVLMISALTDAKQSALDAGASAFLAKPFEVVELLSKIKQLIH